MKKKKRKKRNVKCLGVFLFLYSLYFDVPVAEETVFLLLSPPARLTMHFYIAVLFTIILSLAAADGTVPPTPPPTRIANITTTPPNATFGLLGTPAPVTTAVPLHPWMIIALVIICMVLCGLFVFAAKKAKDKRNKKPKDAIGRRQMREKISKEEAEFDNRVAAIAD